MTDGTAEFNASFREGVGFYYDLVKANVGRIVLGLTHELRDHPVAVLDVTPGWSRSENMLENFGVTEETWRDALEKRPGFAISESPTYVGSRPDCWGYIEQHGIDEQSGAGVEDFR